MLAVLHDEMRECDLPVSFRLKMIGLASTGITSGVRPKE